MTPDGTAAKLSIARIGDFSAPLFSCLRPTPCADCVGWFSAVRNSFVINEDNIVTAAVFRISSVVKVGHFGRQLSYISMESED